MEINVPGGVDQVQFVALSVAFVIHDDGTRFDGDPPRPFQFHVVQ